MIFTGSAVPYRSGERCHDLLNRALTVAEFQDVLARSLYPDHAFGEEHNLLLALSAPAATGCEAGLARFAKDEARSGLHSKGAGRRPSRLDVGKIERVQLRPENVALCL